METNTEGLRNRAEDMTEIAIAWAIVAMTGLVSCVYLIVSGYDIWTILGVALLTMMLLPKASFHKED